MAHRILLVDDEPTQLRLLEAVVSRQGYTVESVSGGAAAIERLKGDAPCGIDLVLLDLSMPEVGGIDVLTTVRPARPSLPIIVLTAHSSVSNVVEAMRAGATDFLVKPASAERIRTAIASALNNDSLVGDLTPISDALDERLGFDDLVGQSPAMLEAVAMASKAARSTIPVLIEGESGVGKEMFARAVQKASERRAKPFITVNCGAIPDNLVESILFGHEKGAFTGATEKHVGKFEEAGGGTLFLDEVGELPLDIQVKLLRALQDGEIDPVGARAPVKVDIRLISATNRDMAERVANGEFREDLYYRLNVFPIRIPPLRKRREDIPALAQHFIDRIARAEGLRPKGISQTALELLVNHSWPGNIRQLQNAIFRAVILCDGEELTPRDFPQILAQAQRRAQQAAPLTGPMGNPVVNDNFVGEARESLEAAARETGLLPVVSEDGHVKRLADVEAEMIKMALARYDGRMSEVARRLGIGRSTLYRKVADLGLDQVGQTEEIRA